MTNNDITPRIPDALPPGYQFDEFEIQEVVDSTNEGIVYRAWDRHLERQVALREFMPRALTVRNDDMSLVLRSKQDTAAFTSGLNNFVQEARQLAQFNHPNLIQVLRFWLINETAYAATPFYSGITLAELHQQQPETIDEAWIRRMLPMVCGALDTLHQGDYIHRDITLKSIQIQDSGIPLLLNSGASRRNLSGIADNSKSLLHPGFAPLEQYTDDLESQIGPWTDIYALGAVLYTLITGTCPPASVTRSIQDTCKPLTELQPQGYSTALLTAVDRALALKPEDRPQSIAAFAELADITPSAASSAPGITRPGTMLVPVEEEETEVAQPAWKRYLTPLQIAAGVLVGVIAGALIFGGGSAPEQAADAPAPAQPASAPASRAASNVAPADEDRSARVYVRMYEGEQLTINGKAQKVVPAANGYGFVQLAPGNYQIELRSRSQSRSVRLTIGTPGTWLLNPQS